MSFLSSSTFPFAADVTDPASVNNALTAVESQLGKFSDRRNRFGAKFISVYRVIQQVPDLVGLT